MIDARDDMIDAVDETLAKLRTLLIPTEIASIDINRQYISKAKSNLDMFAVNFHKAFDPANN